MACVIDYLYPSQLGSQRLLEAILRELVKISAPSEALRYVVPARTSLAEHKQPAKPAGLI
jgi:hypothetical protein